jgi:hypothetical protein
MANTFKKVIDRMMWVQVAASPNAHAAGTSLCADMRNDVSRNPFVYNLVSNAILNRYNIVTKSWQLAIANPLTAGTFGAGAASAFVPSFAAVGTLGAGNTTTSVVLSTALPAAVGVNMLANRGGSGDYGFKIRIIDTTAGKIEERFIVGNTAGTTPTLTLDNAFTFTPANGARYELLSGRVFMLGAGTVAAGVFRSFEVGCNALASLTTTNLPATISADSAMLVMDEQYVPYNCVPGEGMIKGGFTYDNNVVERKALTATAAGASTLTGQSTGGDAVVAANEYRNFQIRIVQDTTTPAAVGQRRIIASHTAGASPVYTLGTAWTTQPSSSAKYVIEQPNLLVLRTSAVATVYTYNYTDAAINNGTNSIAANAWSTTYFANAPATSGGGTIWVPSFGIQPDAARNARHSFNYSFRGNATTLMDVLDIAGGTTGAWTNSAVYDGSVLALGNGTTSAYAPYGQEGRFAYINLYTASAVSQIFRFDAKNRVLSPYTPTDFLQSGTAAVGGRVAAYAAIDGNDRYDVVLLQSHLSTVAQELIPLV